MSAVWWLPHEAGQPDQRTEIGRVVPKRRSNSFVIAIARVFVSMRARLQKSVPVHATMLRKNGVGAGGKPIAGSRSGRLRTNRACRGQNGWK